jgi:tetratricopeptide (TPR) repeat protein
MTANSPTGLPDLAALWDFSQPAQTEARFRDLLPAAQSSGDRDYHLQLLTQIARAQGLQRQYDRAHATLDHVRDVMDEQLKTVQARYLLERGRCFNDTGQYENAKANFLRAWELAQAERLDGYAVDAAHMLGIIEPADDDALAWNLRAAEYAQASADPDARRWLGTLQNNIGWTYYKTGRYADALAVFDDALAFRQAQGKPGPIRIARYCVAKALRVLGRLDDALAAQQSLLGEFERTGEPDGYVLEEIAECLLALRRPDDAAPYFARAYKVLSKDPWFPPDETARLTRIKQLGEIE